MAPITSLSEIEQKYNGEWILIEDPEVDEHFRIIRGAVVWHSKDRDEVYQKMLELRPREAATIYVGRIPEDTAIVL